MVSIVGVDFIAWFGGEWTDAVGGGGEWREADLLLRLVRLVLVLFCCCAR